MACLAGKIWRKHGTLECSGDDLEVKMGRQGDELGLVHPAMATQTHSRTGARQIQNFHKIT